MPPFIVPTVVITAILLALGPGMFCRTYLPYLREYKLFKPLAPLPKKSRQWIENRLLRLAQQYGDDFLTKGQIYLQNDPRLGPGAFDGSDEAPKNVFEAVCEVRSGS